MAVHVTVGLVSCCAFSACEELPLSPTDICSVIDTSYQNIETELLRTYLGGIDGKLMTGRERELICSLGGGGEMVCRVGMVCR